MIKLRYHHAEKWRPYRFAILLGASEHMVTRAELRQLVRDAQAMLRIDRDLRRAAKKGTGEG